MSDISAKAHRCCQCHAVLDLTREHSGILPCLYCGSEHKISNAKADEEARYEREKRVGAVITPYIFAAAIGFVGFLAYRDFRWAPYEGRPSMLVAVFLLILGLMSFRMAATVGLAIVGIAGILKPFVIPISSGSIHPMSPTSETAFYYLIPGVLALLVAFAFFSSLRVREVKPALMALLPRVTVALLGVASVVGAYYWIGESVVEVVGAHKPALERFEALSQRACLGQLPAALDGKSQPNLQLSKNADTPKNTFFVACGRVPGITGDNRDPLLLDEITFFRNVVSGNYRFLYRSAQDFHRVQYADLAASKYLVVVKSEASKHRAFLVEVSSGEVLGTTEIVGNGSDGDRQLRSTLRTRFPPPKSIALAPLAALPKAALAPAPILKDTSKTAVIPPLASPTSVSSPAAVKVDSKLSATFSYSSKAEAKLLKGSKVLWIYGIVENTGEGLVAGPMVEAVFLDEEGVEVGFAKGYGKRPLKPGEKSPIRISKRDPPHFATIRYETRIRGSQTELTPDLVVSESKVQSGTHGSAEIVGKVKNGGDFAVKAVVVHIAIFNSENVLVDMATATASLEAIEPGAEARFSLVKRGDPTFVETKRIELHVTGVPVRF